jgi:lipopolysaccharide transport system permease protein
MIRALWDYRGFIFGSVKREFQSKYRNSLLGASWTVINPLAMILIYTVIFSQIMRTRLPGSSSEFSYSIYLTAGVIGWGCFAEIASRAQNVFLDNSNLLKKQSFPRICLPVITCLNAFVNLGIVGTLFLCFLLLTGTFPGVVVFSVLPLLMVQSLLALGLGILLGVLNVFFRDVGQFFNVFLQFWFWLTPVVYSIEILPPMLGKYLIYWNPMAPIIKGYHAVFVAHRQPDWSTLFIPISVALVITLLGLALFRRRSGEMVDEL